jgi:hypothetical protein
MSDGVAGAASYTCSVYPGAAFRAVVGVAEGDRLGPAGELVPGDVYRLDREVEPLPLAVADAGLPGTAGAAGVQVLGPGGSHRVAEGSAVGRPGADLIAEARLTFLAPDGHSLDLTLIATEAPDGAALILALAHGPLAPGIDYTLAGIGPAGAMRLADMVPFAFAAGTRITMADGTQRRVETLSPGETVLTRDAGPQPLRAVLPRTERALGPHAPVVIRAETLGNPGDLILSQHQRLLVYQRGPDRLTETAEMLVRAGHLVDGERMFLREGGFVDYVSLVLDSHEMLYAECIAVESLEVNAATLPRLPDDQAAALAGLDHAPHYGTEAGREIAAAARRRLLGPG